MALHYCPGPWHRSPLQRAQRTSLSPAVRRGYGLGSVATGAFGTVPGLLLLPYLTDRLGVAAGIAGLLVFLPKAWDVVLNPIVGGISDRSTNPAGRRRPFLIRAGLTLALAFVVMFSGPTEPTALVAAGWVVLLFLGCATAYAFFQVPYVAMPAEMTGDYDERTRLMSWRVAILALTILISGGLSPVIRDALGTTWGYRGVGLFVGLLIAVGTVGAWWGTRNATMTLATAGGSLREQLRVVAASVPFRTLLTVFVVQALATGAMLAGVDYVARVLLASKGASTILFVCFVGPALVVTPLWQRIGRRRGKQFGYVAGSLLLAAGALLTLLTVRIGLGAAAASVALIGVGYAACQMFPLAMLPDVAAADTEDTGQSRAGTYTGVWTAGETLGLAMGPLLYAAVLAVGGYVSSTDADAAQPSSAHTAIAVGFTVIPACSSLARCWSCGVTGRLHPIPTRKEPN